MLQIMTSKEDKKKYPTLSARVPGEFEKRFDHLLGFIQKDHPTLDKPTFVRMLLGCDTRIAIKQIWRDYLSGNIQILPGEPDDPARLPGRPRKITASNH
jgi:hypothetical protein